ncbi:MAG: cytochrome c [Paracoccaceae bacterium]
MLKKLAFGAAGLVLAASAVVAESHVDPAIAGAIKARQAHMQLNAFNIGVLGAMAQDKMPYDAAAASAAASNLVALAKMNESFYWPEGSDTEAVGDMTAALPAAWQNMADVGAKAEALTQAAMGMEAAAGTDLDTLKAAMGPLGAACGACHKEYRQKNE